MTHSFRYQLVRILNTVWIYILSGILIGAYIYQFETHQMPCPLCEIQRLSMICVSIGPMLNLRFGIKPLHYAVSLSACIFGGAVSLRHICLHICPGFPTFGYRVLGFELYTWAFFVFSASLVGMVLLFFLYKNEDSRLKPKLYAYEKGAFGLMFLIALANVLTTFLQCGWGPCTG